MKFYLINFLLVFFLWMSDCDSSKLNVPRVLLPVFKDIALNFTLEVSGSGCYKWSSSRPDLVSVFMGFGVKCSRHAVVNVITRDMNRNTAVVLAQDQGSGQVLRADVILDVIHTLTMVTKTRKLHLDEPPELFEVRALDKYGNMFTSLLGVEFHWSITNQFGSTSTLARVMPFKESTYETPQAIRDFEIHGKQGYIALLEGLHMGSAKVSVKLTYQEYDHVLPEVVRITIVTSLILEPSHALIMVGDTIRYKLIQIKGGKLVEIDALYTKYYLKSLNEDIVITNGFEVSGQELGEAALELYDYAVNESSIAIAEAKLSVVNPTELTISVSPDFSLITGEPATILAHVHARDNQEILLGHKGRINLDIPSNLFLVSSKSFNGSVAEGRANHPGNGMINATLKTPREDHYLTASSHLYVYSALELTPSTVVFPWHPSIPGTYTETLIATGGDGSYSWHSDNTSVAAVRDDGSVVPTGPGLANVQVSMRSHTFGSANAEVLVIEPSDLELIRPVTQVEVGEFADIFVKVTGLYILPSGKVKKFPFLNCEHMKFNVKIDIGFRHVSTLPNEYLKHGACAVIQIVSSTPSVSTVSVSFNRESGNEVEKRTVVAAYERFTVVEPSSRTTTLAVGSSRHIVFDGGPLPFLCKLFKTVSVSSVDIWSYSFLVDKQNHYVVRVTCEKLGLGKMTLSLKAAENCKDNSILDQIYSTTLEVLCVSPSVIKFSPSMSSVCPRAHSNTVFVNKNSEIEFVLSIIDADGHKFDNATSLHYKWSVDNTLATIDELDVVNLNFTKKTDHIIPGEHFKIIETHDRTGIVNVQVSCLENQIEANYKLIVVNEPTILPNQVVIFNHPSNRVRLSVTEGSGYYNLSVEPQHLADVSFDPIDKVVIITPLADGEGILNVMDLCISNYNQLINVKVVNAGFLKVDLPDKVQRGSKFEAVVRLYYRDDYPLVFPDLSSLGDDYVTLLVVSSDVAEIVHTKVDKTAGVVRYTLKALEVGETIVEAKWRDINSPEYTLQVFPPVKLSPKPLLLAVGAEIQLSVTGGPSPDPGLQFSSSDSNIGTISSSAIVKGLHAGAAIIHVNSYCKRGVICSKDSVELTVVVLSGIQIDVPIVQLGVGRSMPAWPSGIPGGLSPLVLGSINPPLAFKWTVSLPGVVRIKDVLESTNINIGLEDKLSVHVDALKPGRTTIYLTAFGRNSDRNPLMFNSSVEIEVIETLDWCVPPLNHATLLVAPNTHFSVTTNRDWEEVINYQDLSVVESSSIFGQKTKENIVEISSSGAVTVGTHPGMAIIMAKSSGQDTVTQQTVAFILQVKQIHYMMANVITELDVSGDALTHLPQGLTLALNITYHDQYGTVFYSVPAAIHGRANRFDKIHISQTTNDSLAINLQRSGSTVINVFDDLVPKMNDYIKLPVGNHIHPNKTSMSVGEMICFWSPVGGGKSGEWSADSDVISVTSSGLAVANRLGTVVLTFSLNIPNANLLSSVAIEVLPVTSVQFGQNLPSLTNSQIGSTFTVPIRLINERERRDNFSPRTGKCGTNQDKVDAVSPPFSCELRFNSVSMPLPIEDVFSVQYKFNADIGEMVCEIMVETGPTHEQSMLNSNVTLRVSVPNVVPESAVLQFNPAYYLHSNHLYLSQDHPQTYLILTASSHVVHQVQIDSSEPTFLILGVPSLKFKNTYSISVTVDSSYWTRKIRPADLTVNINSPLTEQRSKITVILEKEVIKRSPSTLLTVTEYISSSRIALLVTLAVITLTIAMAYCNGFRDSPGPSIQRSDQWYFRTPSHSELREHVLATTGAR